MLAKVVAHGGNSIRYALAKEKAQTVKANNMPDGLEPSAMWHAMKHHCLLHQADGRAGRKLERFMVSFVISPSKDESAAFGMEDWARLMDESLEALDSVELVPQGMMRAARTNFRNSMCVGGLHSDSKSGTLHLHVDCCRVDMDGKTNDAHDIHLRAMKAAEIVNMRHGWLLPGEIRRMRAEEMAECCDDALMRMDKFSVSDYFRLLQAQGYLVRARRDKEGKLVGYTLAKNATLVKASDIGRKYMASRLEDTWRRLHPAAQRPGIAPAPDRGAAARRTASAEPPAPDRGAAARHTASAEPPAAHAGGERSGMASITLSVDGQDCQIWIPRSLEETFASEALPPDGNDEAAAEDVAKIAMLLFSGCIDAATSAAASCGGGGDSAPLFGWGPEVDEDDRAYARRCLAAARAMCIPKNHKRKHKR